jgi:hypothetical protein
MKQAMLLPGDNLLSTKSEAAIAKGQIMQENTAT